MMLRGEREREREREREKERVGHKFKPRIRTGMRD